MATAEQTVEQVEALQRVLSNRATQLDRRGIASGNVRDRAAALAYACSANLLLEVLQGKVPTLPDAPAGDQ